MKKFLLLIFILLLITPPKTFAHMAGQPPYFKVNDKLANLYPVPLTSLPDFPLPQDSAPEDYLVNQVIRFEIDTTNIPAPPEAIAKSHFDWDFGDGAKAKGLKADHKYQKPGSYILKIDVDDKSFPTSQIFETILINILPSKEYQLPKAIIKVNDKESADPITDILDFPFDQPLKFDATSSKQGSAKIVDFFWDFGDQQSSSEPITTHSYQKSLTQVFPVLRVKDENGFFSDSFLEVQNQTLLAQSALKATSKKDFTPTKKTDFTQLIIFTLILLVIGTVLFLKKNRSKKLDSL